eukprot:912540_1
MSLLEDGSLFGSCASPIVIPAFALKAIAIRPTDCAWTNSLVKRINNPDRPLSRLSFLQIHRLFQEIDIATVGECYYDNVKVKFDISRQTQFDVVEAGNVWTSPSVKQFLISEPVNPLIVFQKNLKMDVVFFPNTNVISVRFYAFENFRRQWIMSTLFPALKRLHYSKNEVAGLKRELFLEFVCCDAISQMDLSTFMDRLMLQAPVYQHIPYRHCFSFDDFKKKCSPSLWYLFEY